MTKLETLKSRLERLPETRRLKNLVESMTRYTQKLSEAEGSLTAAVRHEEHANAVFGAKSVTVATPARRRAARAAKQLALKLREDIGVINSPRSRVNDTVTSLCDIGTGAGRDVKADWQRLIDQKLKPYDKLVDVARKLALDGAEELASVMLSLRAARESPPGTAERAAAIRGHLQALPKAVQALGLDDAAVRQFVIDAATGAAKLKVFFDTPAIAEFIRRHKLWDLFRVATS